MGVDVGDRGAAEASFQERNQGRLVGARKSDLSPVSVGDGAPRPKKRMDLARLATGL